MATTAAPSSPPGDTSTVEGTELHWGDIVVIVVYFVAVIGVGLWSSLRNRGSTSGYFLAGRSMHWIPVGASLFASNIGSGHFIGLAGSGAASGIGIAVFELNAIFVLMILGWVFVPVYIAAGVFTMPEYLRKRFGGQRIRVYLAVLALILYVFTKISADLYSGALFIEQSLHWDLYLSVIVLLLISALFTICGGLTAVIWTDFIQTIIMIIGAFVLMGISFSQVGGFETIIERFFTAVPNVTLQAIQGYEVDSNLTKYVGCGFVPKNSMHLMRAADDPSLPWPGVMVGLTISSIWYWCSDQVIVQRALAAKNLSHAKAGTLLAGYLKFLPLFLLVIPGMIARILFPDRVGCADPEICFQQCKSRTGCTNMAYPLLVIKLMPDGARGLMLAVMMAALMSSLTSIFNSSSTIFTMDIWRRFRTHASEVELMIVGRLFVVVLVAVSVVWIPIVQNVAELFHYIQAVTSYLAPPVCAVYVLAVLWKRINETGAFWGLMVGLLCGLIRFVWEYVYPVYPCGEEYLDLKPDIIGKMHYLHFGILLFGISAIVTIVISLLTPPIPDQHLHRLTFWSRHSTAERTDISEAENIEMSSAGGIDNVAAESDVKMTDKGDSTDVHIEEDVPIPWWKKAVNWICGIEKMSDMSDEEKAALELKQMNIEEKPGFARILNLNAIILMTLAMFLWGFFA